MNNSELNQLLKAAKVPVRDGEYWVRFPRQVLEKLAATTRPVPGAAKKVPPENTVLTIEKFNRQIARYTIEFAAACVVIIATVIVAHKHSGNGRLADIAGMKKMYDELQEMFPQQIRSVVLSQSGASIDLAEAPSLPRSQPIYLEICRKDNCARAITTSGQSFSFMGESFDVLLSHSGQIIIAGSNFAWSSDNNKAETMQEYNVFAARLQPKS